ncbi:RabGAP/TBC [Paxillus ammoniavirescens]|nr:RabGAP/TBC [Paxillus ammoniavirescens]
MDDAPSLSLSPPSTPSPSLSLIVSSVPDLASSSTDQDRSSTETAIFTIYSMYGDEEARASWSASAFEGKSQELDLSLGDSFTYGSFFNHTNAYPPSTDSTCIDLSPNSRPFSKLVNPHEMAHLSSTSSGSSQLPYTRPTSGYAASSPKPRDTLELPPRSSRVSAGQNRPRSAVTSRGSQADSESIPHHPVQFTPLPTPPHSRPPSVVRRTDSPVPEPTLLLTPPQPTSSLAPPQSSQTPSSSSPTTKQHSKLSSPSSKTSLVPSEGEDLDAFHVRSTYAQLDATGVRGDGYEEGVERTRARLRASRASELRAEAALSSPSERLRDLPAEELSLLSSLDRYGFFTIISHDRLVRLPSAPLLKHLSPVTAGSKTAPSHAVSVSSLPPPSSPLKEAERIAKWGRMMEVRSRDRGGNVESWAVKPLKAHKLRRRVYKGIPDRWRTAAWEMLMTTYSKSGHEEVAKLGESYQRDLEKPSGYDIQIDLDVPRTISGHILFRTRYGLGQRSLFHVLHSFSLRCEQCGYVQGMGPIAATLLCYFAPERVYAALTRLHDAYSMHTVFSPGFPGLLETIYVQERMMELKMPAVYAAFKEHMISTTSYATKWYITLFANSVPFQTQLRLWDAFLFDGQDVFVAVAIAIVWAYRDHITSSSANFETVLSLLSSFFVPEDEDSLLSWIEQLLGDKKLRAQISRWRQDWSQLVASGKDGDALL